MRDSPGQSFHLASPKLKQLEETLTPAEQDVIETYGSVGDFLASSDLFFVNNQPGAMCVVLNVKRFLVRWAATSKKTITVVMTVWMVSLISEGKSLTEMKEYLILAS